MISVSSSLSVALVLTMCSYILSTSLAQVLTAGIRRPSTTIHPLYRAFTTSSPKWINSSDNASVVTYSQLKSMISNHDIQLFDVRNPDEYQAGRIAEAVNIPLGVLEETLKLSPELFEKKFEVRTPRKDDDNIVFHCKSGNRSAKALDIAFQQGFTKARHYKGGYTEWVEKEGK